MNPHFGGYCALHLSTFPCASCESERRRAFVPAGPAVGANHRAFRAEDLSLHSAGPAQPGSPTKWCNHCRKDDHTDSECWSTRVVSQRPLDQCDEAAVRRIVREELQRWVRLLGTHT